MPKDAKLSFVLIEWTDATGGSGWRDAQGCADDRLAQVFTVGIVLHETDEYVSVAQNISADENAAMVDNTTIIPKANIINVQQLVETEVAKKCKRKTKAKKSTNKQPKTSSAKRKAGACQN
jgi:hypothetical protein